MRLGFYLSTLQKPELERIKEILNLTDEQTEVFDMLSKRKSIEEISLKVGMSTRTVDREIKRIKNKIFIGTNIVD